MTPTLSKKSIRAAQRVYWWLLLAPIVAVPCWLLNSSSYHDFFENLFASTLPLLFYLPIFLWAFSPDPFVRVHARQGLILLALRFVSAVFLSSLSDFSSMIGPFIMCNGGMWFLGGMIGLLMAGSENSILRFDRSQIIPEPATPAPARADARDPHLRAFRTGNLDARKAAIESLQKLGEVEEF